jgi:hypothetical protein
VRLNASDTSIGACGAVGDKFEAGALAEGELLHNMPHKMLHNIFKNSHAAAWKSVLCILVLESIRQWCGF